MSTKRGPHLIDKAAGFLIRTTDHTYINKVYEL